MTVRLVRASGLDAVRLVTELLQRARLADRIAGLWEAADLQWWWRMPRVSDSFEQSFWLDDDGPVAAVIFTNWVRAWGCDPILMPDVAPELQQVVWTTAIELARSPALRLETIETLVRDDDSGAAARLAAAGFEASDNHDGTTWMAAGQRPSPEPPPSGFVLLDRGEHPAGIHWIGQRSGVDAEPRLRQVSLYDPRLDLAIQARDGTIAGYALFWFDPVTHVGLVEPMRVEEHWQRRGLAKSLLTNGLDRLARRGATRMKVSWGSPPGRALYLGAGFREESTATSYRRKPLATTSLDATPNLF